MLRHQLKLKNLDLIFFLVKMIAFSNFEISISVTHTWNSLAKSFSIFFGSEDSIIFRTEVLSPEKENQDSWNF